MTENVAEVVHLADLADETERELGRLRRQLVDAMLALSPEEIVELRELRKVARP